MNKRNSLIAWLLAASLVVVALVAFVYWSQSSVNQSFTKIGSGLAGGPALNPVTTGDSYGVNAKVAPTAMAMAEARASTAMISTEALAANMNVPAAAPALPAVGGGMPEPGQRANREQREPQPIFTPGPIEVNPFTRTSDDPLSTFALDVDTGSYTAMRNYVSAGQLPPADTVRVEEFVNYFKYGYPAPQKDAFGVYVDSAPSPFGTVGTQIVRVGIQGRRIESSQRKDAVLTFVIDVSGSMQEPNRLPLVKESLRLLVNELRQGDKVGIVVYGSEARVLLPHTGVEQRERIMEAMDSLQDEGSTNAEAGLRLGYEQASNVFGRDAINRVILCSDGVANVGATGPDDIRKAIRDYTAQGVQLTTVGFGMGDYNDSLMEQLADDGDGNYAYVDSLNEAKRVFVENLTGTLQVIAKETKAQVEFNPAVVKGYRLLGYENRAVADADFRNDKVDAGEIGAGHSVTALYEVEMLDQSSGPALTVRLRYADPKSGQVSEIAQPFDRESFGRDFAAASPQFQLAVAVAGFAEKLRNSSYAEDRSFADVYAITQRIAPQLPNDVDAQEFMQLVRQVEEIAR